MHRVLGFLVLASILAACTARSPIPAPAPVPKGTTSSGGGDSFQAEFKDIGRTVVRRLRVKKLAEIAGVSTAGFEETLEKVTLTTTEAVLHKDDKRVDALNFPTEMRIELSLFHWAPTMTFFQKRRLVVHEIVEIMGHDDFQYRKTSEILASLGLLHMATIEQFTISAEQAKIVIENMHWKPEEMKVDESVFRGTRTVKTHYLAFTPIIENDLTKQVVVDCEHMEWFDADTGRSMCPHLDICKITPFHAMANEEGTIQVHVGIEADPLWRLFYGTGGKFDHQIIKGDIWAVPQLEFFQ